MYQIVKTSLLYFGIVFGIGFVLGTLRVTILVPSIGERWAELLEMPLMLFAIFFTAKRLVRQYGHEIDTIGWLGVGILALLCLLSVEFTVVLGLRGISLSEYFHSRDLVAGSAYLLSLIIYMMMPIYIYKYYKH